MDNAAQSEATIAALDAGLRLPMEPSSEASANQPPALVAIVGDPQLVATADGSVLSVDYILVSNRSPSDPNPIGGQTAQPVAVVYPWIVGRWYDLPVVMAQNIHTDIHQYFTEWHVQQWVSAGGAENAVRANMVYWFPYWCGWGYWWWSWHGSDCVDIGVGEGESLDVEPITPVRVFYPQWPPTAEQ